LGLTTITFLFVFQILRDLLTHITYNFELSPSSFIPILLLLIGIFGSGMLAGLVSRFLGLKFALTLLAALIGILRFALQIFVDPTLDLVIGALGAICFFLWFPLLIAALKKRQPAVLLFGFLFGVIADTALHGVFVTYGLAARHTIVATTLILISLGIQLFLLKKSQEFFLPDEFGAFRNFIPLMGWGFVLFLNFMFFQNIALVASTTGFHLAIALLVLMLGNVLSILIVSLCFWLKRMVQAITFAILGVLFIIMIALYPKGSFPLYLFWYGQIFLAFAMHFMVRGQSEFSGKSINWLAVSVGIGGLGFGFVTELYYLGYVVPLLFDNHWYLIFAATMAVVFGFLGTLKTDERTRQLNFGEIRVALGTVLFVTILFPMIVWFSHPKIEASSTGEKDTVRVMTYNLHNGFDTSGKMSIDEQIALIKASVAYQWSIRYAILLAARIKNTICGFHAYG
jgi:hypothetical protein